MIGDTVIRTCKVCGKEFPFTVKGRGRHPDLCDKDKPAAAREASRRYRRSPKGQAYFKSYRESGKAAEAQARYYQRRKEIYDPWLWENTILEWDE